MSAGIIFILLLALFLVIFTLQNSVLIELKFLFWELVDIPLVLALIVFLIIGFIAAMFIYYPQIWKLKSTIKKQQKQISKLEENKTIKETHPEGTEITGSSEKSFFNEED